MLKKRGKPRHRWVDRVKQDIRAVDESARLEDALDVDRRRSLVEAEKNLKRLVKRKTKIHNNHYSKSI